MDPVRPDLQHECIKPIVWRDKSDIDKRRALAARFVSKCQMCPENMCLSFEVLSKNMCLVTAVREHEASFLGVVYKTHIKHLDLEYTVLLQL